MIPRKLWSRDQGCISQGCSQSWKCIESPLKKNLFRKHEGPKKRSWGLTHCGRVGVPEERSWVKVQSQFSGNSRNTSTVGMTTKDRDRYGMKPAQVYQTGCVCSLLLSESTVWEKNKCHRKIGKMCSGARKRMSLKFQKRLVLRKQWLVIY